MRRAVLLAVLCGCAAPARGPAAAIAPLRVEVEAANRSLEAAFARGDLLGVAAHYLDDAVLIGPGWRGQGRAEVDAYWTGISDPVSWDLEVLAVEGEGDLAVQRGRSTLVQVRDGVTRTSVVEFVAVWRRRPDGTLGIAVDTWWSPPD